MATNARTIPSLANNETHSLSDESTLELELSRALVYGMSRRKGLKILIRTTWEPKPKEVVVYLQSDNPTISHMQVKGDTVSFCLQGVEHRRPDKAEEKGYEVLQLASVEYRITGKPAMKLMRSWGKKITHHIAGTGRYEPPSKRLLFSGKFHLHMV